MKRSNQILGFCLALVIVASASLPASAQLLPSDLNDILLRTDQFLDRQTAKFPIPVPSNYPAGFGNAQVMQTYDLDPTGTSPIRFRADIYDTSMAAYYYTQRGNAQSGSTQTNYLTKAKNLLDGIRVVQQMDNMGDGRIRRAYHANDLLSPDNSESSIFDPGASIGPMAYAGIALTRFYHAAEQNNFLTQNERDQYLDAAKSIATWINTNTRQNDSDGFGGFSIGRNEDNTPLFGSTKGRSTEHNLDVYVLAKNLAALDSDPTLWSGMADHAQNFVHAMFDPNEGKYWTGTQDNGANGIEIGTAPVPADTQTWTALAGIDDRNTNANDALNWMLDTNNLKVTDATPAGNFTGIKFSDLGEHIQSENTASAVIALLMANLSNLNDDGQTLLEELNRIRLTAPNHDPDGIGVLATPSENGAFSGFEPVGSVFPDYPNDEHVASTVWTGLAALAAQGDFSSANILQPLPEPTSAALLSLITLTFFIQRRTT